MQKQRCRSAVQPISIFDFATQIVQSLFYLYSKFQASSLLLCLYRTVCVGPGRKPQRPFLSHRGSISGCKGHNCRQTYIKVESKFFLAITLKSLHFTCNRIKRNYSSTVIKLQTILDSCKLSVSFHEYICKLSYDFEKTDPLDSPPGQTQMSLHARSLKVKGSVFYLSSKTKKNLNKWKKRKMIMTTTNTTDQIEELLITMLFVEYLF